MASRTRRLVCSEIGRLPVRTYETVLWDTPATRATSLLVYAAIANPLLTCCRYVSSIRISERWRNHTAVCRKSQGLPRAARTAGLRRLRPRRIGARSHELNGAGFNSSAVALIWGYVAG